jgi:transposase-like protein
MTIRQRREFKAEFKLETIELIARSDRTIVQVANDLLLGLPTLTRWKWQ